VILSEQLVAGLDIDLAHIGVKGAKSPQAYLAFGRLSNKGLEIYALRQQLFVSLAQELAATKFSAAGLNFPFSVPAEFMEFCAQKAAVRAGFQSWQEYVEYLFSMDAQQFLSLAREFKREPLRSTDKQYGAAVSPLHRENPPLIELTYLGMRNLASLDPEKFCILPFHDAHEGLCSVLEVNLQETLSVLKPSGQIRVTVTSKGSDAVEQRESRRKVIEGMLELKTTSPLSFKEHPDVFISPDVGTACAQSEHALNAVVACYTAALWVNAPSLFEDPYEGGDEKVLLEGWKYVPRSV
jgi:hypothetical protein